MASLMHAGSMLTKQFVSSSSSSSPPLPHGYVITAAIHSSNGAFTSTSTGALVSFAGVKSLQTPKLRNGGKGKAAGGCFRTCKQKRSTVCVAASVETAESSSATDIISEQRRAILEENERTRGFTLQEVETVGFQDWHPSKVVSVQDLIPGVLRCITVETEVSREFVALDKAYTKPGQIVQLRMGEKEARVAVSSPPFSQDINVPVLYKLRGDIPAGTTKMPQFSLSVKACLDLHVEEASAPEFFNLIEGQELELGAFEATGLDLRPVMFLARFPTLIIFAQGLGIAVARAIVEAKDGDIGSLNLNFRNDVRLYYTASKPSMLAYQSNFADWEAKKVKVCTAVDETSGEEWQGCVGSFTKLWDEDDIEYDPQTTAAVVCVEKGSRDELRNLLAEAGIPQQQIATWDY
ncbi:unnamed protein product [Sphagnum balticum]